MTSQRDTSKAQRDSGKDRKTDDEDEKTGGEGSMPRCRNFGEQVKQPPGFASWQRAFPRSDIRLTFARLPRRFSLASFSLGSAEGLLSQFALLAYRSASSVSNARTLVGVAFGSTWRLSCLGVSPS